MNENEAFKDQAWLEPAVLGAIAAGASLPEVERMLGREAAANVIHTLEQAGLVHAHLPSPVEPSRVPSGWRLGVRVPPADEPAASTYALTDLGRQTLLATIERFTRAAAELDEERQHVERLRTDLLSTMSHELRTPLTLIRTSIGLLLDSDPDEEMQRRLLRNIKQSTDRMHLLVTDLLDLARIRGDRIDLQVRRIDLERLVSGAISLLQPLLDEKRQSVDLVAAPLTVPGDYRKLERVLLNVLGNAIKFSDAGTRILVTVRDQGNEAHITVQDEGPGIPEEAMPHLFDQFFTARTSSTRYNIGAGLGLPIARGIIEAHGGRIWVESAVGAGTTVSFALPRTWPQGESDENPGG